MITRTIEARTHGRFLVVTPSVARAAGTIVAFHGYGEAADQALTRLRATARSDAWLLVAVQALNRFYQRRTDEVIAGWMTRQDRELAIADNLAYVRDVVDRVVREWPVAGPLVFAGFSQGTAMAFRAAAASSRAVAAVVAAGGDIPPEIADEGLRCCGRVLLCRGRRDEWYTADKFATDIERLRRAGVEVHAEEFEGGHEWSDPVARAVSELLARVEA